MFERFTAGARAAVTAAQTEARDLGHHHIGTEHTLIALLGPADGPIAAALRPAGVDAAYVRAEVRRRVDVPVTPDLSFTDPDAEDAAALKAIGIDLSAVRAAIEANFGDGALRLPREPERRRGLFRVATGHTPFTPRNKKVLELSLREAIRLKHKFIAPEHILLGILREGECLAARILIDKQVDTAALRDEMSRALNTKAA